MKRFAVLPMLVMLLFGCLVGCKKAEAPGQNGVSLHIYGTESLDFGSAVVQMADGGYAIAGAMTNVDDGLAGEDLLLLRTNANGELLWKQTYSSPGRDRLEDMLLMEDGGFLMVGQQAAGLNGNIDMLVMRTDAGGAVQWTRNFGGAADDFGTALVETTTGEFVAVGYTASLGNNASTIYPNILAVKFDENGNEIWVKAFGGDNEEKAFAVAATSDGGVAIAGNVYFDSLDYEAGLWRIASNGDSLWNYHGLSNLQDEGHGVATLANGNICLVGYASEGNDFDIFILEVTDSGIPLSNTLSRIGGDDYDRTISNRLVELPDGSLVIAGYTMSFGNGANDFYITKVSPEGVYVAQWANTFGGSNDDIAKAIIPTAAGGFAIVGYTKSFSFNEQYDIALVVTNGAGEMVPVDGD